MSDLKGPSVATPTEVAAASTSAGPVTAQVSTPNPSSNFHAPAKGGVIDLRKATHLPRAARASVPTPIASPATPTPEPKLTVAVSEPKPLVAPTSSPTPVSAVASPTAATAEPQPTAIVTPMSKPAVASIIPSRREARMANVQAVTRSDAIQKFQGPQAPVQPAVQVATPVASISVPAIVTTPPVAEPIPRVQSTPATPVSVVAAPVVPLPPEDKAVTAPTEPKPLPPVASPFNPAPIAINPVVATPAPAAPVQQTSQTPAPLAPVTPIQPLNPSPAPVGPAPTSAVMPGQVVTTIEANKKLLTPAALAKADPVTARKEAFALALANAPKRSSLTSAIAAVAVVVVMGGYIWLQNVPKLAVHTASAKAGFDASLPSYVPSSYTMQHDVSAGPGHITLAFSSPSGNNLIINQQKTSWDSQSLLDNYVSKQSSGYLTVNNQGLTIYLYNGDAASWVNQGVWYSIQGNNQLNREQLLKIAYGL